MVQAPTTQEPEKPNGTSQQSKQQEILQYLMKNKNYGVNGKNILTYSARKI